MNSPPRVNTAHGGTAPHLPLANAAEGEFAGVVFRAAPQAPAQPGIFVLTRAIGGLAYPAYVGEGEDMAQAEAAIRSQYPSDTALTNGVFYMDRPNARLRAHTVRDLVGKFDPPLNTEGRKGPAPALIAAIIPDRSHNRAQGPREQLATEIHVTEADLDRLVKEFYACAGADPVLGPVFARAITDWDEHHRIVRDFWSRTLLGTTRYTGNPFSAHIMLKLKPEHFVLWVAYFKSTARSVLEPAAAERAIAKVEHMSTCFQAGLFLPNLDAPAPAHGHPHASPAVG